MITETDSTTTTVTGVSGLIDVHTHFPAQAHRRALERAGRSADATALPAWNAEQTLDVLGEVGVEYAVLSPTSPPVFADVDDARRTARDFNEELADQIADGPTTYGGVAFLPLPHVDAALEELAYALDVLKLEGVHVYVNYRGVSVGDEEFAPLLDELDRRRVTVVAHPTCAHDGSPAPCGGTSPQSVFEVAQLASTLVRGRALELHPDVNWILAHGGTAILQAGRSAPRRGLHVDVVGNVAEPMLGRLTAQQGPDKLLFGTGMPLELPTRVAGEITTLMADDVVGEAAKRAITRDNALRLFPSVARKLHLSG